MQIRGFPHYFSLATPDNPAVDGQSIDPITQLWDLFSLGIPLCYIFDLLPEEDGFTKINHSQFNQEQYTANPDRAKKRAIALFAMQLRTKKFEQKIPACETFTVTDLWGRNSTDGFLKVCTFPIPAVRVLSVTGRQHRYGNRQLSSAGCV
jgi:cell division control protein 24